MRFQGYLGKVYSNVWSDLAVIWYTKYTYQSDQRFKSLQPATQIYYSIRPRNLVRLNLLAIIEERTILTAHHFMFDTENAPINSIGSPELREANSVISSNPRPTSDYVPPDLLETNPVFAKLIFAHWCPGDWLISMKILFGWKIRGLTRATYNSTTRSLIVLGLTPQFVILFCKTRILINYFKIKTY